MYNIVHTKKRNGLGQKSFDSLYMVKMSTKQLLRVHAAFADNTARNANTIRSFYFDDFSAEGVVENEGESNEDETESEEDGESPSYLVVKLTQHSQHT